MGSEEGRGFGSGSEESDGTNRVSAYSGGLDTSVAIRWLAEKYDAEIIAVTLDLGQGQELTDVRERALAVGAVRAHVIDAREEFARDYVLPALQAARDLRGALPAGLPRSAGRSSRSTSSTIARMEGATADRARLHRQGQRPGAARRLRRARSIRRCSVHRARRATGA